MANLRLKFTRTKDHQELSSSVRGVAHWTHGMVQEVPADKGGEWLGDFPNNFEIVRDALEDEGDDTKSEGGPMKNKAQHGPGKNK